MLFLEPADLFFFITTLAVVVVSAIIIWVGILLIKVLRNIQYISHKARMESDRISDDVDSLRAGIKKEGVTILHFFHSLGMLFSRPRKAKKTKR